MSGHHPDEMDHDPPRGDTGTRGSRRRALALIPLVLPAVGSVAAGAYQLFPVCCLPLLILGPALLHRDRPEATGPADDGEGPDDNGGSPPRDIPPNLPSGGLLLPDAEPAARRYRGEPASTLIPSRTRRPAHPPERQPVPLRHSDPAAGEAAIACHVGRTAHMLPWRDQSAKLGDCVTRGVTESPTSPG